MTNQSKTTTPINHPSKLDSFNLDYELDVTWGEVRKTTRQRISK